MTINALTLLENAYGRPGETVEGLWKPIQLRPDFASSELINIGVIFVNGECHQFRLLDDFEKFSQLYGEAAEDELQFVVSALSAALTKKLDKSPFPSVQFGDAKYARGANADEIISRLFTTCVSLLGPTPVPRPKSPFISNTKARNQIFGALRVEAGLDAERILARNDDLLFQFSGRVIALDVPLQPGNRLGTVVSAGFTQADSVERMLLRGYLDLTTAVSLKGASLPAFFIYRPEGVLQRQRQNEVDNVIDIVEWKLSQSGIHTAISDNIDTLADNILVWAS